MSHSHLGVHLNSQEEYAYKQLFKVADVQNKSFLGKQEGMIFFSKAGIPLELLQEIWQSADREDKGYITEAEFYFALKLIACAQNGIDSNDHIQHTQVPLPQFQGITIKPKESLEFEPITATEREKYIALFHSCNLVDGLIYGEEARKIFLKSRLPVDKLNSIWMLADTRKSGTLNKTEFIIAMHYISRLKANPTLSLPQVLPSQTYVEATGNFASTIRRYKSPVISNSTLSLSHPLNISRKGRDGSTLTVSAGEIEKYKVYFDQLDTDNSGFIEADEAVYFFSHSQLSDSELGLIWEIADSRRMGKLDLNDFSVAMHLINMRKNNLSIDQYLMQNQPSPNISNQHGQMDLINQRYELENQLIEIKQQTISQQKTIDTLYPQLEEIKTLNLRLESEISAAKNELNLVKKAAENAERQAEAAKLERGRVLGFEAISTSSTPTKAFVSTLPELTRASSTFSGSTILSPGSEKSPFDPFSVFTKPNQTPKQAKAVSKYGFDITMFDSLSLTDNDKKFSTTSVNDDLASLFNVTKNNKGSAFDSVFT